jgi:PAS domain S-box-containing protein
VANRTNDRSVTFLARFCAGVSGLAFVFGLFVLSGWAFHVRLFRTIIPGQVAVKANTAICFVLLGLALWLVRKEGQATATGRMLSRYLALTASLIGLLSFLEFWKGWNLGIDQLLFHAGLEDLPGSVRPGLMSPLSGASFFLLGIVVALLDVRRRFVEWLQSLFTTIAAIAALFGIQDFIFEPYQTHTHISPTTALLLLLMSFALVCCRTKSGVGALLVSESPGGEISRRLLPAAIFIPLTIAWLRWKGQQIGFYSDWTGLAIMTAASAVLLAALTIWTAVALERTEERREKAEQSVRRLAAIVTSSNEGIIGKTLDGIVTSWNAGAESIYGYSAEEIIGHSLVVAVPPERLEEFHGFMQKIRSGELVRDFETVRLRKDGRTIHVSLSSNPLRGENGKLIGASTITSDITERKRAEEALNRSETRYRSLVTATAQIVWTTNAQGEVVDDMPMWRSFAGMTLKEIQGWGWINSLHPDDRQRATEVWNKAVAEKSVYEIEYRIRRHDGEYRTLAVRGVPVLDHDGAVREWVGTCTDITERKQAEATVAAERQKFNQILDVLSPYVCLLTPDYYMPFANQEFRRRFGEAKGRRCYEFLFNRAEPCEVCETYKVLQSGQEQRWEWTGPDGRKYEIYDYPFTDTDGQKLILEMGIDVTARKEAEFARKRAEASTSALVESTDDLIWSVDLDFRLRASNRALQTAIEQHHGHKVQLGMLPEELLSPAVAGHWYEMYKRALTQGPYHIEYESSYGRFLDASFNLIIEDGEKVGISVFTKDVTQRKRAESEWSRLQANLSALLDSAGEMIWSVDLNFRLLAFNDNLRKHLESSYGSDVNVGMRLEDQIPPEKVPVWAEMYRRALAEGPFRVEYELVKDHVLELSFNPIIQDGNTVGISVFSKDITERKRTEAALRESEQKFSTLADLVPQFVWMCTPDGLNIYFNQRWFEYTGLSKDESHGKGWNTPFHPDDKQAAWNAWNHATATGEAYRIESRLRAADGSYRWFLMRGTPMRDDAGTIVRWFGTCTDIDDMKRAEAEIRALNCDLENRIEQRTVELRESEQRVRRKLDSILLPEGDLGKLELADILDISAVQSLLDEFHSVVHVTTALIDLQGKILAVVGWQNICKQFHRVHPEAGKFCVESDRELSTGIAEGEFRIYKCRNQMWDVAAPIIVGGKHLGNLFCGQFFFADELIDYDLFRAQARQYGFDETKYMAALDEVPRLTRGQVNASMTFLAKLAKMISQLSYSSIKLARSSTQIGQVNAELSAANKELEAFTYSVSHDLRAPLRHISGFSKILSEEFAPDLPPDAQHHVQRIQEGTRRMGQLVDDLLNLGRVGRKEVSLQVAGLRSIVDDVIATLKSDVADRQVQWKIGELPYVECDTALIHQVFQNLLANALKFTRPRAQAVIEIGQEQRDGGSVVYVRDNGVGFSMKYADKLFGVFQRLHRAEDFEGTGVGLATVQRIIQKHGGRIWAQAELDKGANFYFTLGTSATSGEQSKAVAAGEKHA